MKRISFAASIILVLCSPIMAQYEEKDFQIRPVTGIWFGPAFPAPPLMDVLNPTLGGGAFLRLNIPSDNFLMEVGASYWQFTSLLTEELMFIPGYLSIVYKLPIDFALSFYVKAGGGMSFLKNVPENHEGLLPIFYGGIETSFPAGKYVNIGVRFDYYFVYETWMSAPSTNFTVVDGHFLSVGIMANFNTNP